MFVIFNPLYLCLMLSWLLTNMTELRKRCTEEDAEISASCSGSKQTGLCIFFYENVNVMSNLENWNTHNTCTTETLNSFKEQRKDFNRRKQLKWRACLHCIIRLPPPVALLTLRTPLSLRSDNAAQFAKWPSWLQFLSESCYCCQVFTSLIAASNAPCIFILSLCMKSNCFKVRMNSKDSLEGKLLGLWRLGLFLKN